MSYIMAGIFILGLIFWRKIYDLLRGKGHFDDIYLFNSKLAEMLKLDLPLDGAVKQVTFEVYTPLSYRFSKVGKALRRVMLSVSSGKSLGDALDSERKVFPAYYVDMVRIGEAEGDLVGALEVLNSYLNVSREYNVSTNQLTGYFTLVLLAFLGVISFLSRYIMPTFIELFKGMNLDYFTTTTKIVYSISRYLPVVLAIMVFIYLGIVVLRRTREIRWYIDRIAAKIPFLRGLIRNYEYMTFCRIMSNLLENYVPVDRALILAAGAANNFSYSEAFKNAANAVDATLSEALNRSDLFDDTFIFMVSLGEKTERLSEIFREMAEYYSDEYISTLNTAFRFSEIGATSVLGFIAGTFVIGIFTPIARLIVEINNSIMF